MPEDRRRQGLLLSKSVRENLTLAVDPALRQFRLPQCRGGSGRWFDEMIAFLQHQGEDIREQPAGTLSGGNQQKVIFGKMLLTEARVLLLFDPTRGVDVGTKGEIFQLMRDLAAQGYAILFYSSDLPELVHVADRVAVMRNGRIVAVARGRGDLARMASCAPPCSNRGDRIDDGAERRGRRRGPIAASGEIASAADRPRAVPRRLRHAGRAGGHLRDRSATTCFSLEELNLDAAAAMTLLLAATGQTIVLIRGGIDLSIGGMISFGTVIAATQFGDQLRRDARLVRRHPRHRLRRRRDQRR